MLGTEIVKANKEDFLMFICWNRNEAVIGLQKITETIYSSFRVSFFLSCDFFFETKKKSQKTW